MRKSNEETLLLAELLLEHKTCQEAFGWNAEIVRCFDDFVHRTRKFVVDKKTRIHRSAQAIFAQTLHCLRVW